jgi:hypothetical protein
VYAHLLCVRTAEGVRSRANTAVSQIRLGGVTYHDQSAMERELRVLNASFITLDLQPHLKSERTDEPINGTPRIVVVNAGGDSWPTGGGIFHSSAPYLKAIILPQYLIIYQLFKYLDSNENRNWGARRPVENCARLTVFPERLRHTSVPPVLASAAPRNPQQTRRKRARQDGVT